jgi:anti-sigma factor RsiW
MDTSSERIERLLALADGQLSPSDRASLEPTLTPEEKVFVDEERALIQAARGALNDKKIPNELWERITAQIHTASQPTATETRSIWRRWTSYAGLAAASILLVVGVAWWTTQTPPATLTAWLDRAKSETVANLRNSADVGPQLNDIRDLLKQQGLDVKTEGLAMLMQQPRMGGHETYLLGAAKVDFEGRPAVVLLFECCKEPVQVVLTSRATDEAVARQTDMAGLVVAERMVGNAHAVLISRHDARGLLDLLG